MPSSLIGNDIPDGFLIDVASSLSEKEKEIFILRVFHGYGLPKIAEEIGCSPSFVKEQYSRAKLKLYKKVASLIIGVKYQ